MLFKQVSCAGALLYEIVKQRLAAFLTKKQSIDMPHFRRK
jgi:hypothetical protein